MQEYKYFVENNSQKFIDIRTVNPLDCMHVHIRCMSSTARVHVSALCFSEAKTLESGWHLHVHENIVLHKHARSVAAVKFIAAARVSMDPLCFEREGEQACNASCKFECDAGSCTLCFCHLHIRSANTVRIYPHFRACIDWPTSNTPELVTLAVFSRCDGLRSAVHQ